MHIAPSSSTSPVPTPGIARKAGGAGRFTSMLAVAFASLALSGCFTPMQELNWIENRVSRNRVPRPSPLQVASNVPNSGPIE